MSNDPAYQALRTAISTRTKPIVFFVGAGLSTPLIPTWRGLRDHLVDALRRKASTFSATDAAKLADQADHIARLDDLWLAFKLLREQLGQTTFKAEIRELLAVSSSAPVPALYIRAWQLPIQGMLTLNLDSFMVRSFSEAHPGRELKYFTGQRAANLSNVLHGQHAFGFSLHGMMDDSSSWVFTVDELRRLRQSEAYRLLMSRLMTDYTIIFVGITVDDGAVGGFLRSLSDIGIEYDPHYWLTDRTDPELDTWAENTGIRIIRYDSRQGHLASLSSIFDDLATYVEPDFEAAPVVLGSFGTSTGPLPSPQELVRYDLPQLRQLLNAHAATILSTSDEESSWQEFTKFSEEYIEAIHRAWFTTEKPPNNTLFSYTLEERVAQGAFGRVYRGTDSEGNPVAVKVLLDSIREDMELRKSFRRGVAAMRILERARIDGMVAYREASEIPAFVSMEWVNGPNLMQAKRDNLLNDWDAVLTVANDLAKIIREAHQLPQAVLHRDIRPANVMLRDGYLGPEDWTVVVLDFDLSTYRGATEKSVLATASALGYLAPEQLEARPKESTRNANVDSFGIGMTLYFLCSGEEPWANLHLSRSYERMVNEAVKNFRVDEWQSLPTRVARLILSATKDRQADRWDVPQIIRELERLLSAWRSPETVSDLDLLAEEIAARSLPAYTWNEDTEQARAMLTSIQTTITTDNTSGSIIAEVSWSSSGDENWSNLSRFLAQRVPRAVSILNAAGWNVRQNPSGKYDFTLRATYDARRLVGSIDRASKGLSGALAGFNFDAV